MAAEDTSLTSPPRSIPFEKRAAEATRILAKYPERIPVICSALSHFMGRQRRHVFCHEFLFHAAARETHFLVELSGTNVR